MRTTRRLMILGAATLAGMSAAPSLRLRRPVTTTQTLPHPELLAIGRGALASRARED